MTPTLKLRCSRKHKAIESGESDRYHKRATCKLELSGTDSTVEPDHTDELKPSDLVEPEHTDELDPFDLVSGTNTHKARFFMLVDLRTLLL